MINRLQTNQGADGFNNMLADSRGPGADGSVRVDFAAHAASLGAHVEDVPRQLRRRGLRGAPTCVRARPPGAAAARPWSSARSHSHYLDRGRGVVGDRRAGLARRAAPPFDEAKPNQLRWLG